MKTIRAYFFVAIALNIFYVKGQQAYTYLPPNLYYDTAYAPFIFGVASGDPLQTKVIIWTKVAVTDASINEVPLYWQVSSDSAFKELSNSGKVVASRLQDFTVKIDVSDLQPNGHYFYRFKTPDGKFSQTGKAQTLPADTTRHFKLAIVSCSSIWSGYFNAYRRIAERSDIDFVIHLGDYAYDYADKDELFRMPIPAPIDVTTLAEWRERHTYYLLDPDLRAARQNKTWIAEWDNHDTDVNGKGDERDAIKAYYEYLPIRVPDPAHPERIYREFHFGTLADLIMIDMQLFRGKEKIDNRQCVLGGVQDAWFKQRLLASKATWRLIGNQEMFSPWLSEGLPKFLHAPGDGKVFDPGNWNGFPEDRSCIYDFIDSNRINNFVVLTGDAHMSFIMDITRDPQNKKSYNKRTGTGALGVELLGPSISRGNMDEAGVPKGFIPLATSISKSVNPHHVWNQFSKHGYATLDVTPERCLAEFWYSKILKITDKETFGRGYMVKNGVNHWEHKPNKKRKKSTYPKKKNQH